MKRKFSQLNITNEQHLIIDAKVNPGEIILVNALGGTGKTTTLCQWSILQIEKSDGKSPFPIPRMLYVVYNKKMQEEARKKFPYVVDVHTVDSLVKKHEIVNICHEHAKFDVKHCVESIKEHDEDVYKILVSEITTSERLGFFADAKKTIECFALSFDNDIEFHHLRCKIDLPHSMKKFILKLAHVLFQMMMKKQLSCSWNIGEKIMAITKVQLLYDVLLVDESQDLNPAMIGIIMNQLAHAGIIFVGDKNQHIYQFKKCVNVFNDNVLGRFCNVSNTLIQRFALTKSFRFGSNIAASANVVLRELKHNSDVIFGSSKRDHVVKCYNNNNDRNNAITIPEHQLLNTIKLVPGEKIGIIFRTNLELFKFFLRNKNHKFHLQSSVDVNRLNVFAKEYKLDKTTFIANFNNINSIDYSKDNSSTDNSMDNSSTDNSNCNLILKQMVIEHDGEIDTILEGFKKRIVTFLTTFIVLTTVHQCKGQEYHTVIMWKDLAYKHGSEIPPLIGNCVGGNNNVNNYSFEKREEKRNLRYVAVTRAISHLIICCPDFDPPANIAYVANISNSIANEIPSVKKQMSLAQGFANMACVIKL